MAATEILDSQRPTTPDHMTIGRERIRTSDGITLVADCYRHAATHPVVLLLHGGGRTVTRGPPPPVDSIPTATPSSPTTHEVTATATGTRADNMTSNGLCPI